MADARTILSMLEQADDEAPAIGLADSDFAKALSFGQLSEFSQRILTDMRRRGFAANDRVAVVLPNGAHMATAFVSLACCVATAPLNPAYRDEEFEFYLTDLQARAVIALADEPSPVRDVAARHGIPVLDLLPAENGSFEFADSDLTALDENPTAAAGADIGLILHTSGTTSRPKMVPLTVGNLLASAGNIGGILQLRRSDRCLNIMPLFHIHGLIAAVLSSLAAGSSVWCSPGFNALRFFNWMKSVRPTWYTAVPTMHQAILSRAARNQETIQEVPLRFIRSSSSSLPPQVMAALEDTFKAPVIESYGMTEATHQMASNPLPPSPRKPGSVGVAAGPEVAIMDAEDRLLPQGDTGEIVIRGANVTPGYLQNDAANATAFTAGWFRTGDQGVIDEDGYLSITGRLKEIINRGGEKISPREVDEILLDHDAVGQAVTFAMPHEKLGEEVAAAVVLKEGATLGERDLRQFVATRVADFKVPRKIVFLDEIPKGATGKVQRIGLAEKLGLTGKTGAS